MVTTANDLVEESRRYLMAGQHENMNSLSSSYISSDTTLIFTYDLNQIQAGSYIAVDLEIMYVWSVTAATKSAVVQRGMLGSTAAAHASGALVYVNPKFPAFSIFQALNADLADLCSPTNSLYAVNKVSLTYNPAVQGYNMTGVTDVIDVLRVRYNVPGPSKSWPELRKWTLKRNANTTDFPSGFGLVVYQPAWPGLALEVTYSTSFISFVDLTTTVTATGLPASAADLPPLGASMRLAGVREVQRNFNESQGDTRRATEVPVNAQIAGMRALGSLRAARIKSEADKLTSSYPTRRQAH